MSCNYWQRYTFLWGCWSPGQPAAWLFCMVCHQSPKAKKTSVSKFEKQLRQNIWSSVTIRLTASLELEAGDVEGDSGDEEGDERSDCDGEEELDDVLLWEAKGRTTARPSATLLLRSSSCWDSETSFPTERQAKNVSRIKFLSFKHFIIGKHKMTSKNNKNLFHLTY